MNLTIQIQGREAIPVRAIPYLANWETMTPDAVALALAQDEHYFLFDGLEAYHLDGGQPRPLGTTWWKNFAVRNLKALSDRIKAKQSSHEDGHEKWRRESVGVLPAGVFVWRAEFEPMHGYRYRPEYGPVPPGLDETKLRAIEEAAKRRLSLDFNPFIQDPETRRMVMEGFESLPAMQSIVAAAPIADQSGPYDPNDTAAAWQQKLAERTPDERKARRQEMQDYQRSSEYIAAAIKIDDLDALIAAAKENVTDAKRTMDASPNTGVVGNVKAARAELVQVEQELAELERLPKVMRGDFFGDPEPQATTPSPAPVVSAGASDTVEPAGESDKGRKKPKKTWRDVAYEYMVQVFQSGQFSTAKQFYAELEKKAGNGSPFDRGTGDNRGSLFVREISEKLTLKTVQNVFWPDCK